MELFIVTFPVRYADEVHPFDPNFTPDNWIEVAAVDEITARLYLVDKLGQRGWAGIYPAAEWLKNRAERGHYPGKRVASWHLGLKEAREVITRTGGEDPQILASLYNLVVHMLDQATWPKPEVVDVTVPYSGGDGEEERLLCPLCKQTGGSLTVWDAATRMTEGELNFETQELEVSYDSGGDFDSVGPYIITCCGGFVDLPEGWTES